MIRTVIIEDEPNALQSLILGIEKYIPQLGIVGTASDIEEAGYLLKKENPELVLLDIKLKERDAFQLLDQLNEINFEIIFITAYGEFKEKAFDYFALHYIQKPVDFEKFRTIIASYEKRKKKTFTTEKYTMLRKLLSSNLKSISIPQKNGYQMIAVSSIVLCVAEGNYTRIHMADDRVLLSSKSLKHYENLFEGMGFYRVHRSQLINLSFIQSVSGDMVLLRNDIRVSVSKRNRSGLLKLLRHMG